MEYNPKNQIFYYQYCLKIKYNMLKTNFYKNNFKSHILKFIENIIDKFLISQFNIPKNLNEISEKIFEIHKKRVGNSNSLSTR